MPHQHIWDGKEAWTEQLILFRRQYLQSVDPKFLPFPSDSTWRSPGFQSSFFRFVLSDGAHDFLPTRRYRIRVLKRIVDDLQSSFKDLDEDEISDDILFAYSALLEKTQAPELEEAQCMSPIIYTLPYTLQVSPEICLFETHSLLAASGSTGYRTWEAALRLGTFFCSSFGRDFVENKRVLELGAGTGLLSILCAKQLGASYVHATDGYSEIVEELRVNIGINDEYLRLPIVASRLWWGTSSLIDSAGDCEQLGKFDLIIGADVTYDPGSISPLVTTIYEAFEQNPAAKAIISATVRNEDTVAIFLNTCARHQIVIEEIRAPQGKIEPQRGFFHSLLIPIRVFLLSLQAEREPGYVPEEGVVQEYWHILGPDKG